MNQNITEEQAKKNAMIKIESINAVEGFDPAPLALKLDNMNDGSKRYHLKVMTQMAWFRLKYPEGKIAVSVKAVKDYFIAEARVYVSYKDPADCYLAEGSASRGYIADKPTVSPREWSQTAAIGMALRNAGFGLQFAVAGESYEDNNLNELFEPAFFETPVSENGITAEKIPEAENTEPADTDIFEQLDIQSEISETSPAQPELTPLEKAMAAMCPIVKYKDKTLGDMVRIDPGALAYVAKNGAKYGSEIAEYARLICEHAVQQAS